MELARPIQSPLKTTQNHQLVNIETKLPTNIAMNNCEMVVLCCVTMVFSITCDIFLMLMFVIWGYQRSCTRVVFGRFGFYVLVTAL